MEDNAQVGEFSSQLLRDLGYQTVLASNAEEALQLIDKEPGRFDVVFSDVVMPGLDGLALGEHIRRRFPCIPFVLTSGFSHVLNGDGNHGSTSFKNHTRSKTSRGCYGAPSPSA